MNEKEQKLLDSWSKLLGNPEVSESTLKKIEIDVAKKEREKRILESFENTLLGIKPIKDVKIEPITIVEEEIIDESFVNARNDTTRQITQSVNTPIEKQPQLPDDFVNKSVQAISKAVNKIPQDTLPKSEEIPSAMRKEMDLLKKSVLDLHQFASRISQMGGGGAGSVDELYFRTISVTGNYTGTNKDYYIGVNSSIPCTITLPKGNKSGRQVIIKDESGACATNNITIITQGTDTIDNNTSAIMAINNMSLTFIYRNGWRII